MGRLRRVEGRAGAARRGARVEERGRDRVAARPRRRADPDAPGRLPRRGHLRPAAAVEVAPALLRAARRTPAFGPPPPGRTSHERALWAPFEVAYLAASTAFYTALGLPVLDSSTAGVVFGVGPGGRIEVVATRTPSPPPPVALELRPGPRSTRSRRVGGDAPLAVFPRGHYGFVTRDPDGNPLLIWSERMTRDRMTFCPGGGHEPPEARGLARDRVRLLVGGPDGVTHHVFTRPALTARPGDVLVVNTSTTMPAAVSDGTRAWSFTSPPGCPMGDWVVEPAGPQPTTKALPDNGSSCTGGASRHPRRSRYTERLWRRGRRRLGHAGYLATNGDPIRYSYVDQGVADLVLPHRLRHRRSAAPRCPAPPAFHRTPGDPAGLAAGSSFAPISLHTGVASPEAHERPYPERFLGARHHRPADQRGPRGGHGASSRSAPPPCARSRRPPHRRAWCSAAHRLDRPGGHSARDAVRVIDGLLTGFHEPRASHLLMLEAIVGEDLLAAATSRRSPPATCGTSSAT